MAAPLPAMVKRTAADDMDSVAGSPIVGALPGQPAVVVVGNPDGGQRLIAPYRLSRVLPLNEQRLFDAVTKLIEGTMVHVVG